MAPGAVLPFRGVSMVPHHSNLGTVFFAVGFTLMMMLDVALS